MKKLLAIISISLLILVTAASLASAGYTYSYPRHTYRYSYPVNDYQYQEFPSYTNLPTIRDRASDSDFLATSYTRNFQGPVIERITKYDEETRIGSRGRSVKTVSFLSTEKYIGASENEASGLDSRTQSTRDYSLTPNNPTTYEGGSLWRYRGSYNPTSFGADRYGSSYYYNPRYDSSRGYYNWRY